MKERNIASSSELFEILHEMKSGMSWAFRGQEDAAWKLLPKVGREDFAYRFSKGVSEKTVFESWKRYAVNFLAQSPKDDWDWLVLAQHHGLATRLLDWTKNPLNAVFFAVAKNGSKHSALYAFEIKTKQLISAGNPFDVDDLRVYFPRGLSPRIVSQRGIFTISGKPKEPLEDILGGRLHKFVINSEAATDIRKTLLFFGINEMSIFQDLDHLSEHLNKFVLS